LGRAKSLQGEECDTRKVTGPAESNMWTLFLGKQKHKSKSFQRNKHVCRDFIFYGERRSFHWKDQSLLLFFLIYDENISAAGKQTLYLTPVFGMYSTKVVQENVE